MESLLLFFAFVIQAFSVYSSNITCMQGLPRYVPMQQEVLQKINETVRNNSQLMAFETKMNNSMLCEIARELASKVIPVKIRRIRSLNDLKETEDTNMTTTPYLSTFSVTPTLSSSPVLFTAINETIPSIVTNVTSHTVSSTQLFTLVPVTPKSVGKDQYRPIRRSRPIRPIKPRRRRRPIRPPSLPKPMIIPSSTLLFAYTLQLLAEQALQDRQNDCVAKGGEYDNVVGLCKIYTSHNTTMFIQDNDTITNPKVTYIIMLVGNGLSLLCLIILLVIYTLIRSLRTRSGKNVMCLAITMALAQLLQLIGVHITHLRTTCTVVGVMLHWAYLASFMWMTVISYDLLLTFAFPFKNIKMNRNSLFYVYIGVGLSVPTVVIAVCTIVHIFNKEAIGYGSSTCFIGNVWASLYTFVMFVIVAMILNFACLVVTMAKIYRGQQAVKGVQSRHKTSAQHRLQLTLMTLKVSTLTSLGWIFGLIGGFLGNGTLTYIFVVLTACQGILIFVAFCCNSRIYMLLTAYFEEKSLVSHSKEVSFVMCSVRSGKRKQQNGKRRHKSSSISSRRDTEIDLNVTV